MDLFEMLAAAFGIAMRLADLLLEYLKVIAWPLTVLALALLYKRPLIGMLGRLRKASGWGATVELENEARELADESAEIAGKTSEDQAEPSAADEPEQQTTQEATAPPEISSGADIQHALATAEALRQTVNALERAHEALVEHDRERTLQQRRPVFSDARTGRFVMNARWEELVKEAMAVGQHLGISRNQSRFIPALFQELVRRGLAAPETEDVAARLHNLRTMIRHSEDGIEHLSPTAIEDFIDTTTNLTTILRTVRQRLNQPHRDDPTSDPLP